MKKIDFERAVLLLDVVAKVTNIGPMNQPILGEAQEELRQIVADCESNRKLRFEQNQQAWQIAAQQKLSAQEAEAEANAEAEAKPVSVEETEASTAPTLVERKI